MPMAEILSILKKLKSENSIATKDSNPKYGKLEYPNPKCTRSQTTQDKKKSNAEVSRAKKPNV